VTSLVIVLFLFVEYLPEDDRKWSKHVGGLPHVCVSLYLTVVQLSECVTVTCLTARNMDSFQSILITLPSSPRFSQWPVSLGFHGPFCCPPDVQHAPPIVLPDMLTRIVLGECTGAVEGVIKQVETVVSTVMNSQIHEMRSGFLSS
jgi:hypothetical protein